MSKPSNLFRFGVGLTVAAALFAGAVPPTRAESSEAEGMPAYLGVTVGVVDYDSLLQVHPEAERLVQFDKEIALVKSQLEFLPYQERERQVDSAQQKLKSELERAESEMMAAKGQIEAELSGLQHAMQAHLEAETVKITEKYKQKYKAVLQQLLQTQAEPTLDDVPADDYVKNVKLLAQREISARKLEADKASNDRVAAERARIDAELAAYEDSLMKQHQQEKLNLQLQVQVAKDEAQQAELQQKLDDLSNQEQAAKDGKRAEIEAQFQAFRQEEKARLDHENAAAQSRVMAEASQKIAGHGGGAPQPHPQVTITDEARRKIAKIEAEMKAEIEAEVQRQLPAIKAHMEAEQAEASERLRRKKAEIEAHLKQVMEEQRKLMAEAEKNVSPQTQAKMKMLQEQLDKLEAQRKELYDRMTADLKGEIEQVAQKEKVGVVIGRCVVNNDCPDLTDLSMVAVKMMQKQ